MMTTKVTAEAVLRHNNIYSLNLKPRVTTKVTAEAVLRPYLFFDYPGSSWPDYKGYC